MLLAGEVELGAGRVVMELPGPVAVGNIKVGFGSEGGNLIGDFVGIDRVVSIEPLDKLTVGMGEA